MVADQYCHYYPENIKPKPKLQECNLDPCPARSVTFTSLFTININQVQISFLKTVSLKLNKCCCPVSIPSHVLLEPMPLTLATVRCHLRVYRFSIGKAAGKALCRVIFSSDFVSLWLLVSDLNKRDGTMFSGFFAFSLCHLISEMIRAEHISGSQLTHFSLWWATPINQNQNQPWNSSSTFK